MAEADFDKCPKFFDQLRAVLKRMRKRLLI